MDSMTGSVDYIQPEPIEIIPDEDIPPPIDDIVGDFNWSDNTIEFNTVDFKLDSHYYIKWSTSYKEACKIIYDKKSRKRIMRKPNSF